MWYPINVQRSHTMLKLAERPLIEHIADDLNELEQKTGGKVTNALVIETDTDRYAELVVRIEEGQTNG